MGLSSFNRARELRAKELAKKEAEVKSAPKAEEKKTTKK